MIPLIPQGGLSALICIGLLALGCLPKNKQNAQPLGIAVSGNFVDSVYPVEITHAGQKTSCLGVRVASERNLNRQWLVMPRQCQAQLSAKQWCSSKVKLFLRQRDKVGAATRFLESQPVAPCAHQAEAHLTEKFALLPQTVAGDFDSAQSAVLSVRVLGLDGSGEVRYDDKKSNGLKTLGRRVALFGDKGNDLMATRVVSNCNFKNCNTRNYSRIPTLQPLFHQDAGLLLAFVADDGSLAVDLSDLKSQAQLLRVVDRFPID